MPMCSRSDARCRAVHHRLIKDIYKCPFEFPCFYCDVCDECDVSDEIENPAFCMGDDEDD